MKIYLLIAIDGCIQYLRWSLMTPIVVCTRKRRKCVKQSSRKQQEVDSEEGIALCGKCVTILRNSLISFIASGGMRMITTLVSQWGAFNVHCNMLFVSRLMPVCILLCLGNVDLVSGLLTYFHRLVWKTIAVLDLLNLCKWYIVYGAHPEKCNTIGVHFYRMTQLC